ncbi:MAG: DUF2064 domain-containing protein [Aquimonas sp.]|nr:DUF2064 domain-containing protein [Aquimonas sp.]
MSVGLALFVKSPGRSPVKSRLWPLLGRSEAEALYLDCVESVHEAVQPLQDEGLLQAYWAVAEAERDGAPFAPWTTLPVLMQGEGALGLRMARVYNALLLRHEAAVLIGTDLPQLRSLQLRQALQVLFGGGFDLTLGPSEDGGFWLVGGRTRLPLEIWTAPRYSTPQALADFRGGLPTNLRVATVERLCDLDEPADVETVAGAMRLLPELSPAQQRVSRRLDAALGSGSG